MTLERTSSEQLVLTQAEAVPPPDVTVPEPNSPHSAAVAGRAPDPQLLRDIMTLADRAGGLEKLRDLVETLLQIRS